MSKNEHQAYGGDVSELFRNPGALVGGLFAALLACGVIVASLTLFEAAGRYFGFFLGLVFLVLAVAFLVRELPRNPFAVLGGFVGMLGASALLFLTFAFLATGDANAEDEDEFEIDFEPGTLVKLGEKIEEKEIPEKIIVQETRPEEETVVETVTEDEKAEAKTEEVEPDEKPKKIDKPPPKVKKDKKLPTSKLPTKKNTPFKDLPTVKQPKGDPFGDPGGWDDLAKDGDPWATAVMKALNNMEIGTFAAEAKKGDFKFQITICKDGSVKKVAKKGGSADADTQSKVRLAIQKLDLPRPPAKVAKKIKGSCAKIKYTFRWRAGGVK